MGSARLRPNRANFMEICTLLSSPAWSFPASFRATGKEREMKPVRIAVKNMFDDLVSLTKICGAVLVVGIAMGLFRHMSSGALAVFY